jgi:hypothetical protein
MEESKHNLASGYFQVEAKWCPHHAHFALVTIGFLIAYCNILEPVTLHKVRNYCEKQDLAQLVSLKKVDIPSQPVKFNETNQSTNLPGHFLGRVPGH